MMIPVIDILTDEIKTVNASDIQFINRTGVKGSVIKLMTESSEYRKLNNAEWVTMLRDSENLIKSDADTYINPAKVISLNTEDSVAEFGNGKQANVSRYAMKNVQQLLVNSK
ncbi:LytTR family transcriptional regulator DNA-binding domain-containing protein [Paenibacillus silvae]|uniref:HTH LytTR-type domain-containing protein n=1 Tax=Paenibacillus silvae TaxID=1325358 RepID=A0A2W6NNP0_9BACL|nr:LytTR family transcriptional regulator DNA-binding domain-containing protein [Paenibacillus silvae]PZT57441.1 hypothetical protein DN757_01950 [Paenibacillus silvae]